MKHLNMQYCCIQQKQSHKQIVLQILINLKNNQVCQPKLQYYKNQEQIIPLQQMQKLIDFCFEQLGNLQLLKHRNLRIFHHIVKLQLTHFEYIQKLTHCKKLDQYHPIHVFSSFFGHELFLVSISCVIKRYRRQGVIQVEDNQIWKCL